MQVYSEVCKNPFESAAEDETKALTGAINSYFPALKEWILSHVKNNQVNEGF